MGRLIEGIWDCNYCNKTNIPASQRHCPSCGHPQDENTEFRLPSHITYVSPEQEKTISRKPNWICPYCDSQNTDNNSICTNCGSDRFSSNAKLYSHKKNKSTAIHTDIDTYSDMDIYPDTETDDNIEYNSDCITETISSDKYEPVQEISPSTKHNDVLKHILNWIFEYKTIIGGVVAGTIALVAIIMLLVYAFTPSLVDVKVTKLGWNKNIEIQEIRTFDESDWTLPINARLKYTQSEIRSYETVIDHYETVTETKTREVIDHYETVVTGYRNLDNGYFEEITSQQPVYKTETYTETHEEPVYVQQPVYDTKYYYEIDRWTTVDNVPTSGFDKNPYWGEVNLKPGQRIGPKQEHYHVYFIELKTDEMRDYDIDITDFNKLEVGQIITIKTNNLHMLLEIIYE